MRHGWQSRTSLCVGCAAMLALMAVGLTAHAVFAAAPPRGGAATRPSDREQRLGARREARLSEEAANLFRSADTTFLVGDLARAAELFQQVITSYPNSSYTVRAHARLGDCAYEMRKYIDAAAHYRRAAAAGESAANDEESAASVRADFMVGQCYLRAKSYTQAFTQFRKFIDRHPGHVLVNQAYQAIGDAHMALEQHQQALRAYRMVGTVMGERTAAHRRISPGQRLYLRVTDADVNVGDTPRSVRAVVRTSGGDVETVELEPLGLRSPVFLASIPTMLGAPRHSGELGRVFNEEIASRIRAQLAEAEKLERTARDKSEEAFELDRSAQRTVNPAATERKRAALSAEADQLRARSAALRQECTRTIDAAFAEYEKILARWAPEQTLSALRPPATRPATAPSDAAGEGEADVFREVAARPVAGADDDEPAAGPAPGDQETRGMTEQEILQVRASAARAPTNMENIDARMTTLSVWSRSLMRQFQRLELKGGDRIEIEYFDEIGPNGPNTPPKGIRKDVVEVATDASVAILTADAREPLEHVVVNSDVVLQVEDPDADTTDGPDTLLAVLAAVPVVKSDAEAPQAAKPAAPATQRTTPGEIAAEPAEAQRLEPLVPPGAASVKVTLVETGPHTGIFRKAVKVTADGVMIDNAPALRIRAEGGKGNLCALRLAYADAKAVRHSDGWVVARMADCIGDSGGDVAAVKYRQTLLDQQAKLKRAVAAGEIGRIYLELGLTRRGREYLSSAQADCTEVARSSETAALAEEALHHSWKIYFYAGLLDDAVNACRLLMSRYPNSEYIDDAMFAMGQASLERGEKQVEQDKAAGQKVSLNRDLARAVAQFEELVKRFPNSPLAPEALFMIGRAKIAAGQTGLDVFERLAKQYPDSVLAARGLVKVADYYMSISDFRRAAEYFGRVLIDYPDSPDLGEVLLQRGICQYKLGLHKEALETFYRVIEEQSGTELAGKAQKYIGFINQKRGEG